MNMKSSTPLTDTNEAVMNNTKYQKAIKEINKLISINTSVKKELISLQEQYDCLRKDYTNLQQKYLSLQEANVTLLQQTTISRMGRQTQSYQQNVPNNPQPASEQSRRVNYSPLSVPNKELENTGTISQFIDTKRKVEELEEKLTQKDQIIKNLVKQLAEKAKQNSQLYEKYIQSSNVVKQQKNEQMLKNVNTPTIQNLQQQKLFLQKQLRKSQQIAAKLASDYQILRKNSALKLASSQQSNAKSCNVVTGTGLQMAKPSLYGGFGQKAPVQVHVPAQNLHGLSSAQQSLQNSTEKTQRCDPFSEYYFKKVRDLEAENLKLKNQYSDKKAKYKSHISRLKQQLANKDSNIQQINQFIAKQQAFIEEFVIKNQREQANQSAEQKQLKKNKMISSPQQYEKQKVFGYGAAQGGTHIVKQGSKQGGPFDKYITKTEKITNRPQSQLRTNTVQSQQYTMTQSQAQQNFGFSVEQKHKFVEGTKYYKG